MTWLVTVEAKPLVVTVLRGMHLAITIVAPSSHWIVPANLENSRSFIGVHGNICAFTFYSSTACLMPPIFSAAAISLAT
jgi:hypothetical protein